jgi:hypothetical protein
MLRLSALAALLAGCSAAPPRSPAPAAPTADDLARVRCATDGSDVVTSWRGSIYARIPGAEVRRLFDIAGMNVARCQRDAGGWLLLSRELMFYLDPETGEVLHRWTNPWTGAEVPVVHVANDHVQGRFAAPPPLERRGDDATFVVEIAPVYPNPLAADPELAAFSPQPTYAALEMFALTAPAAELGAPGRTRVSTMQLSWHRVGPWLPWMQQGDRPGALVYSARGERVDGIGALAEPVRSELARLPLYRSAPRCASDRPNMTSWRYFAAHVDAYRRGDRFPLPAPATPGACRQPD